MDTDLKTEPKQKKIDVKKMDDELNILPGNQIEGIECEEVTEDEMEWLLEFGEKLVAKCALSGGAGLAAPQVGINKKVFAWMFKEGLYQLAVNPKYFKDGKKVNMIEGCLSYPGEQYFISRHKYVWVNYFTINRKTKKLIKVAKRLREEPAIIFQHETDHLNGETIATKGKLLKKAILPQKEANGEEENQQQTQGEQK